MRSASTEHPSSERPQRPDTPTGVARATPLTALDRVPWGDIQDSTGSAAAIPVLLSGIAWGDADTARSALDDLRKRICQFGFVVEQATAATVPFLWELAKQPQVTCRAQIIRLLKNIADARQWESTAAVYPKLLNHRENPVVWERAARQAVRARRGELGRLMDDEDTEIARATNELARSLGA
ncbi:MULTISPECIES: hypothetical protein [Streptomyces]|uniref:AbaA n=1 Tax=Streptomyces koelreuteriae TaxID=2838015 RepID=A0ABX8FJ20_9ACTN|nr:MULTISPECIES: hypothetical protein [Streptomyces]QWB21133.1 hypothetical protein KJK29_00290 [Streptomyces koelreuteriae]UUA04045.1 hypothetical protein NNW98_00285 [Streptomyces koelreuteriae]UUA11671.1 hypothetical protein NNW99_00285 [Streptomyces sp. CRCS-T-1]